MHRFKIGDEVRAIQNKTRGWWFNWYSTSVFTVMETFFTEEWLPAYALKDSMESVKDNIWEYLQRPEEFVFKTMDECSEYISKMMWFKDIKNNAIE